jgi:hypothetical protein
MAEPEGAVEKDDSHFAHPRCYARSRGDCAKELSSEHFFSRALLERIDESTGGVYVRGFPWQKSEVEQIGINRLASKVLCRHHNSQLSLLDQEALRLVTLIEKVAARSDGLCMDTVNGHYIERYLLKVLCGLLASKSVGLDGNRINWPPPVEWIEMLWGDRRFPYRWGLKVNAVQGEKWTEDPGSYHVAPIFGDGIPVGLEAVFRRVHLYLIMTDPAPHLDSVLGRGPTFMPTQFNMKHQRGSVTINLRW